jgi:hypothetical protein
MGGHHRLHVLYKQGSASRPRVEHMSTQVLVHSDDPERMPSRYGTPPQQTRKP